MKNSFNFTCSRKCSLVWALSILAISILGLIIYSSDWCQKIMNPWSEHGRTYCSKLYNVCISNEPEWSIKIPTRNFTQRTKPIISFLVLDFQPERVAPDINAEVLIFSDYLPRPSPKYEVSGPLDFLLLLQQQSQSLSRDFHVLDKPAQGTLNGHEMATMRGTSKMISGENLDFKTFVFVVGHQGFTATYRAGKKHFDRYLPEAMKIIESLKFGGGGKP